MRYPAYSEYRDSGFEWLGELPANWEVRRLKNVLACPVTDGPHTTPEFVYEGIPFLSVDGIQNGELQFDGCRFVSIEDHEQFTKKVAPKRGDVLLGKAASTGKIAQVKVDFEFSIWSPLALLRADPKVISSTFLEYSLKSPAVQAQIDVLCTHNTQSNISMDDIPKLVFPVPPAVEQQSIAAFLDWKTGQIDALIAKKKELLEKLKEKCLAVITQAVTKGLNPAAPLRDSGISWLGQVPKHWEVKRLRFLLCERFSNGLFKKAEFWGDGTRIVNVTDLYIHNDLVDEARLGRLECDADELQVYAANHGDFFVVRSSLKLEGIGKSAALLNPTEPTVFECHIVRGRPNLDEVHPRFLNLFMNSTYARQYFMTRSNVVTMATIDQERIKNLVVALPGYDEQQRIAEYLDKNTARIDSMVTAVESVVTRLTEYRTSLITAATTGKIDVRKVDVPSPA